jgi:serine/threonine protein kinase
VIKIQQQSVEWNKSVKLKECYIHKQISDSINMEKYGYGNIVHYIDHFIRPALAPTLELCLVMEYCELGSLYDFIERMNKQQSRALLRPGILRSLTKDIAAAVFYLHHSWIVHRDIKPDNVMLTFDHKEKTVFAKLGDFGFAQNHRKGNIITETHAVGSMDYAAPELLQKNEKDLYAVDIWALGVTFFALLEYNSMFHGYGDDQITRQLIIQNQRQPFYRKEPEYSLLRELIVQMTEYDHKKRIDIDSVIKSSPWFLEQETRTKVLLSSLYESHQ